MSAEQVTAGAPVFPVTRRVRAYFAPVVRETGTPTIFDPAYSANLGTGTPPAPWMDLGWIRDFKRESQTKVQVVSTGVPSGAQFQTRDAAGANVSWQFEQWTKLTMALAAGAQHMNVLTGAGLNSNTGTGSGAVAGAQNANGSGRKVASAVPVLNPGAAADFLELNATDLGGFSAGGMVAVDVDYAGQLGYVGTGVSAAYVKSSASVQGDADYIRRVTFNVARIRTVTSNGLQLATPLPAGAPVAGMKVQPVSAFVDREGGTFFQEWSALFVMSGEQGDQVFFHYPRLQAMAGGSESVSPIMQSLSQVLLKASFRALPVTDSNDGERVYCFRTYVPSAIAAI